jgi:eukaryotic-like serine/threonine-protein kinase
VAPVATLPLPDDAPQDAVPSLGTVIADKYRIEELIARGGMGAVYMATHLVSGKKVALKWMLPSLGQLPGAKERFVREACATARIEHPNVIDIYDVGNDRGSVYLVMELLRGETLAEYLQRTPTVSTGEAISLIMPALRGVAAAHAHDVIHRDLKPDNIFLCRSAEGEPREPRVLDFGISKVGTGDDPRLSLTRSGAVMGTPYYMSPEQVRGANQVDERGDIYAFGVILYEMLTGQRPFEAETYNQLILKIATEDPAPILELNPAIDRRLALVIERAMARDPRERFSTIEELAVALEPFSNGTLFRASTVRAQTPAVTSGEHTPAGGTYVPVRRRSRAAMVLGIALGGIGAGLGFWALAHERAHPEDREPATLAIPSVQTKAADAVAAQQETVVSASTQPEPANPQGAVMMGSDEKAVAVEVKGSAVAGKGLAPDVKSAAHDEKAAAFGVQASAAEAAGLASEAKSAAREADGSARVVKGSREAKQAARDANLAAREAKRAGAEVKRSGSETKLGDQSASEELRARAHSAEPEQQAPAPRSAGKLPDDWDERLSIPSKVPATATNPAGPIDARDLR